jgi:hypothetical protein
MTVAVGTVTSSAQAAMLTVTRDIVLVTQTLCLFSVLPAPKALLQPQ